MVFFICSVIVVQADRTCRHLPLFYEGNHLTPRIEKNITPITNAARKERGVACIFYESRYVPFMERHIGLAAIKEEILNQSRVVLILGAIREEARLMML